MIKGFKEAVDRSKYNIGDGFHCNDINNNDFEDDMCYVFDKLAEDNGEPPIDWEWHEDDEQYGNSGEENPD